VHQDIREIDLKPSVSPAWGALVHIYWNKNFSRRHRYRTIMHAINDLSDVSDKDWNIHHTDFQNKTTVYFRDTADAVTFSFYYS